MKNEFNTIDFYNKWIVVSGASSGIGRGIARALAACNANLVLLGRNQETLAETAENIPPENVKLLVVDLSDSATILPQMKRIIGETGAIYGFCHCAGIVDTRPINVTTPDSIMEQLNINLVAGTEIVRALSKRGAMEQSGSIVFISSVYAHVGGAGETAYCATKGAVSAAVRAMAVELSAKNIRVNSVSPGYVHTAMTSKHSKLTEAQLEAIVEKHPLGPGTVEDVARAVIFLLHHKNTWVTGADLLVDGGYTSV
jgi:NAD(P)-dependent dehydrogenase (short-subunit alcohol dehydrogenase family)